MNRFRLSKKNDFQTQKKFTKMGSCLSAPTDVGSVDTSVRNIDNGSDDAALIYYGNMVVSSKISVHRASLVRYSYHLSAKTCL